MLRPGTYPSKAIRQLLRRRGIQAMIPERSDQKASRKRCRAKGGRPVGLDKEAYKRRNVVERSFNLFKQWRGLTTRHDKPALTYRGGVFLRAITIWLKELGDTPQQRPCMSSGQPSQQPESLPSSPQTRVITTSD